MAASFDLDLRRRTIQGALLTVAPLTRTVRAIDSEVVLDTEDGVPARSAVTLDNIATIEQDLLTRQITTLSVDRMNEVGEAIQFTFEMPF